MNLSVVLATRNEEENIGRCLKSIKGLADEIIVCSKALDENDEVSQWDVSYKVVDPNDATRTNSFCVTVLASEMTDPTSLTEAKTKANVKASAKKTEWLAQPATSNEVVINEPENVTLP